MKSLIQYACVLMAAASVTVVRSSGQISLTGGTFTYSENFDSMGSGAEASPPSGWFAGATKRGGNSDATNGTLFAVPSLSTDSGGSTTGTNYNYGTVGDGDRAIGSLTSANAVGSNRVTEVRFINNTGFSITNLSIHYDGEQWRDGGTNAANQLSLHFSLDGSTFASMGAAFTFTAPVNGSVGAKDGNLAANRVANIGGDFATSIDNGALFYLRWVDIDDAGSDDGLAIDNFDMTYSVIPEPSTFTLLASGFLLFLGARRRRR
ncbi:MAG TPA: PEP-CTERM sorting domain-containing protein [Verrucomicrobiae bacterium]|nr:PEP-CTERM sorting domain-containing protein [Verrucomicrobiae bacterium]